MKDINTTRLQWLLKWPAQCVLASNKTRWTRNTENAILKWKFDLRVFYSQLNEQLFETVDLVRKDLTPT